MRIEVDEYELLPNIHFHGNQSILFAVEVFHAFEFGHAFQRTVQPVIPPVIRTVKNRSQSARFGYDGCRMMPADVVKRPQDTFLPRTATIGSPATVEVTNCPDFST